MYVTVTLGRPASAKPAAWAVTIKLKSTKPGDFADLIRFHLASKPAIRDLLAGRLVLWWQLMEPSGYTMKVRPHERVELIKDHIREELRLLMQKLAAARDNARRSPPLLTGVV